MPLALSISPHGRALIEEIADDGAPPLPAATINSIRRTFEADPSAALLRLATVELRTALPPSLGFARDVAQRYLTRLCHVPELDGAAEIPAVAAEPGQLAAMVEQAPPMKGLEYLTPDVLADWWSGLDAFVRGEIRRFPGGASAYLRDKNPLWRLVGRVTMHLAENKRDEQRPFAFLATYTSRLSAGGDLQHLPLSRALKASLETMNRESLIALLTPIQRAAERLPWVKDLVESNALYQPLAWTPNQAFSFLRDIPLLEESGLVVRVPDWWKSNKTPRPQVSVRIGNAAKSTLGVDAMLDFSVGVTLEGEQISEQELQQLLASTGGLVRLRGAWVEVDREKLQAALDHWKDVERGARHGEISFFEGMRLLAGADAGPGDLANDEAEEIRRWTGITAGDWLKKTLESIRNPARMAAPNDLRAQLRPYQQTGMGWLYFLTRLGLGACLADDMGLGKTIQMLALLLQVRNEAESPAGLPSLLIVPTSLIANWKSEIERFSPSLKVWIAHASEAGAALRDEKAAEAALDGQDLVITSYGMLPRLDVLSRRKWRLVVLDEAQAIKNSGTRQAKSVKQLKSQARVALTGTPVENRLSDLWSLFDFLNPGLLGSAGAFTKYVRSIERSPNPSYASLRSLVRPYILRRLKTDKKIISDLPDKTEVKAFCGLSKKQAAIYEQSVRDLGEQLSTADGIKRRGLVLAFLMRFKQICNHPSQWLGDATYEPGDSGKFQRLADLCEELSARQEKVLVFTQFREITDPLSQFLATIFGRPGAVLHGGTEVGRRREMVEAFQRDNGPPFFVLSIKAGGTGLNLTAASQVIHFDRWWNPAVENQATDRAFRIGQKKNVIVHKFVCRGTVEEKIDRLITEKTGLSEELLGGGAERILTEMNDRELLKFVALDISKSTSE